MRRISWVPGLSYLLLLFFSLSLAAANDRCFVASAQLQAQGDDYYSLKPSQPLSRSDFQRLDYYLKALNGRWSGKASQRECEGLVRLARSELREFRLRVQLQSKAEGELSIAAEWDEVGSRLIRQRNSKLVYGESSQAYALTGSQLLLNEKYRMGNGNGTSRLVEKLIKVDAQGNSLTVYIAWYHNGYFVSEEEWSLKR